MSLDNLKVLIVAPHVSAESGGEAILPYHYFRRLSERGVKIWLLAHERNRAELEAVIGAETEYIFYAPDTILHRIFGRIAWKLPSRLGFFTFTFLADLHTQRWQQRKARELVKQFQIDIVHEPARVSPRYPSMMYGFEENVSVIIGPMNGGMSYPEGYSSFKLWIEQAFIKNARNFTDLFNYIFPGKHSASVLLVANDRTKQALPSKAVKNVIELVENGVDTALFHGQSKKHGNNRVRFVYMGRLVDWKAVDIIISAVLRLSQDNVELHIVGDGTEKQRLYNLIKSHPNKERVVFHGFLTQEKCVDVLAKSHCYVLPSLYECGGASVLEAMAMGLPVIATDWGGPVDYLDEDCGVLISPHGGTEKLCQRFYSVMKDVLENPDKYRQMGVKGREKVCRYYNWERKIDSILNIYQATLAMDQNECECGSDLNGALQSPLDQKA